VSIELADIITDPDFAESFTIRRSTGQFALGGYTTKQTNIATMGVIRPTSPDDLDQLPEGDRVQGMVTFWSPVEIRVTGTQGTSDVIFWDGDDYRILQVFPSGRFGFWKAIGTRMTGE
jgi:hypothetical protein